MFELLTPAFIRTNGLPALSERYAIKLRRHEKFPNLVHLKYSQCDSPMGERIVQECRGLILDEADDWRPVCVPYFKFFNHGEGHAAPIDWTTARVQEKLDGSLIALYNYRGSWQAATTGTPDGSGNAESCGLTFSELFWQTYRELGYRVPLNTAYTYLFELMTRHNRVIVCHPKPRLVLHGVRKLSTLQEESPTSCALTHGWEFVREFPLNTLESIVAACNALNPVECEGYVVVDAAFNRIKVKSPQYVALSHLKEGMNGRRLLDIVRTNEASEFLSHFPEWTTAYNRVRDQFDALCGEVELDYRRLRDIPSQKDFALEALKTRASGALFALRGGKVKTAREFFAGVSSHLMEKLIDVDSLDLTESEVAHA